MMTGAASLGDGKA
jgi:putative transposase